MKADLKKIDETKMSLEEKIYKISIENKQKQDDKDVMLMLLP